MFKCNRCKSVSISLVNQYTVNLYFNGSHWGTEYANISTRENHNTRLSSLFKDYEFDFYKTGSYETCNDCDYIQNHNTTTQRKMAYGVGDNMETFIGVNKVPSRLYILQTENGEDVNEEPVTYKELVNMILESDVRDCLAQSWADSGRAGRYECSEERADFYREHAEDEAKECGYKIIEVLRNV